jgi:exosortase E/protease (VPEID-CTERM system)
VSYDSVPDADATFDQAHRINWGALARILIAALIVPELIYFSSPINTDIVGGSRGWWLFLVQHNRAIAAVFSTSAIAAVLFGWESFRRLIGEELRGPVEDPATRAAFLALHLAAVACLVAWDVTIVAGKRLDSADGLAWFLVGAGLSAVALLSWFAALLPARSWLRWARINPVALASAIPVAIFARIVSFYTLSLWRPLTASTFWAVDLLLRMLGQTTFVEPDAARIGRTHFTIMIAPACSGLEGIGLMSVFVAGYLWFCRRELRFPAALILLPAGVVSIWFLNVVRIAALILIGAWSERVALDGFHTVADWLFYTFAACGIVVVSRRSPMFSRAEPLPRRLAAPNPASVYLAPMLTILLIAMLTRIAGGGFDFLYPLKVIGAAAVLWFYRKRLVELRRDLSWFALMLGGVVFIEWIVMQRRADVAVVSRVRDSARQPPGVDRIVVARDSRDRRRRYRAARRGACVPRISAPQAVQCGFRSRRFSALHIALVCGVVNAVRAVASAMAGRSDRRNAVRGGDVSARCTLRCGHRAFDRQRDAGDVCPDDASLVAMELMTK